MKSKESSRIEKGFGEVRLGEKEEEWHKVLWLCKVTVYVRDIRVHTPFQSQSRQRKGNSGGTNSAHFAAVYIYHTPSHKPVNLATQIFIC